MIITRLKGGLGNQMFQYVAGLRMANIYDENLKLDVTGYDEGGQAKFDTLRKYRLMAFNLSSGLANNKEAMKARNPLGIISRLIRVFNQKILNRFYIGYEPTFFTKRHAYVEGFFQSEKNFGNLQNKVREESQLKKEFEGEEYTRAKNKIDPDKSVSVHVRRGDYANDKVTNSYFGTCSIDYYKKAMDYVASKVESPLFYFFSDDIDWVKNEFGEKDNYIFISNGILQDYEELMLMSYCSHNIIANSSFSWWGAWLNVNLHKIVIAPKEWLQVSLEKQPKIVPDSWIKM